MYKNLQHNLKMSCPIQGDFDVCEVKNYHGGQYVEIKTKSSQKVQARRTKAGAYLALIRRLKKHQSENIPYSVINKYFRDELGSHNTMNPMGTGFIIDILTYDPRTEQSKDYNDVLIRLEQAPSSLDWTQIWDVLEGLVWD